MKNKNVLVTGANGMIGRQLVKLLKETGANVTGTDLPTDLRTKVLLYIQNTHFTRER